VCGGRPVGVGLHEITLFVEERVFPFAMQTIRAAADAKEIVLAKMMTTIAAARCHPIAATAAVVATLTERKSVWMTQRLRDEEQQELESSEGNRHESGREVPRPR
jgi:hypothetical protein